jgi:hypothetical protein
MSKEKLSKSQLAAWVIASNRVSLESLRYAADIWGYTPLTTATVAGLENLIEGGDAGDCRKLYRRALKASLREEPLLHPILLALKWAASDGRGEFMVGNCVDPIYNVRLQTHQPNQDSVTYEKLREIHNRILGPYYEQLEENAPVTANDQN